MINYCKTLKRAHIIILILVLMPIISIYFGYHMTYGTNEGSYQYGFWSGSNSGPQYGPGLNENPEFYNNTCSLAPTTHKIMV